MQGVAAARLLQKQAQQEKLAEGAEIDQEADTVSSSKACCFKQSTRQQRFGAASFAPHQQRQRHREQDCAD